MQQPPDNWYLPEKKDYEAFATKYPLNGEVAAQAAELSAMQQWCTAHNIRYTPTIFLDGYELPPGYSPEEIAYFLQE